MLLKTGDKIHVVTRRQFEKDLRRHFIGEVTEYADGIVRATGYAFVFDTRLNKYVRRPEKRERLFSILDAGNIVNVLPEGANIQESDYRISAEGHLVVTDGKDFTLDINEFSMDR